MSAAPASCAGACRRSSSFTALTTARTSPMPADSAGTIGEPHLDWGALIRRKNAELDRLEAVYRGILRTQQRPTDRGRGEACRSAHDRGRWRSAHRRADSDRLRQPTGLPAVPGVEHVITSDEALGPAGSAAPHRHRRRRIHRGRIRRHILCGGRCRHAGDQGGRTFAWLRCRCAHLPRVANGEKGHPHPAGRRRRRDTAG